MVVGHTHCFPARKPDAGRHIHDDRLRPGQFGKLDNRQANSDRPPITRTFLPAAGGAMDRMATDGECFDQGELFEGHLREMCSLRAAGSFASPHAAVTHHPSVWWFSHSSCARATGVALLTLDVRLDGAAIDRIHVAHPFPTASTSMPVRVRECAVAEKGILPRYPP